MHRSPLSPARRRVLAIGVTAGVVLGLPALALAATLFIFGSFSGSTGFADTRGTAPQLTSVTQVSEGGVNCSDVKLTGGSLSVKPKVNRTVVGTVKTVQPGSCVLTLGVKNPSAAEVIPALNGILAPTGWTVALDGAPGKIAANAAGTVKVKIAADATAAAGPLKATLVATDNGTAS